MDYKEKWDCHAPKAVLAMTEGERKYEKEYKRWIPACAGMTNESGNDKEGAGMTLIMKFTGNNTKKAKKCKR